MYGTCTICVYVLIAHKKKVAVVLSGKEINQIKYETTLLQETNRNRGASCCKTSSFNLFIRSLSRIDFDLIPSVSM